MNRMDRLFALVLQLQSRGMARAQDLAQAFDVSQRTVYRDVQSLCDAGVPVVSLPGQGYAIGTGSFLPPLMFTDLEAGSLALGAANVARTAGAPFGPAARSARAKLGNALTAERRRDIRSVQDGIAPTYPDTAPAHHSLQVIRDAIFGRQVLTIAYHAFGRPHAEDRVIEPYGLVYFGQAWHLLAFCRQRQAPHLFRLDRVDQVTTLGDQAESLGHERYDGLPEVAAGTAEVLSVRVAARSLRALLRDRPCGPADQQADGAFTILRLGASDPERLLRWLMQWAGDVEVIAPPYLRRRFAALGELVAAAHSRDYPNVDGSLLGIG